MPETVNLNRFLEGAKSSFILMCTVIGIVGGRAGVSSKSVSVMPLVEDARLRRLRSGLEGRVARDAMEETGVVLGELSNEYSSTLDCGSGARRREAEELCLVLKAVDGLLVERPSGEEGKMYIGGVFSEDDSRERAGRGDIRGGGPTANPVKPDSPVTVHFFSPSGCHDTSKSSHSNPTSMPSIVATPGNQTPWQVALYSTFMTIPSGSLIEPYRFTFGLCFSTIV